MAAYGVGPQGVTVQSPPARDPYVKVGILEAGDTTSGVALFGLPKYAVPIGVYTISAGANATQTVKLGYSDGGTELINAFAPDSTGYAAAGAQTGSGVGVQLTADKLVYAKASATLTNSVIFKVEYIIPPQGLSL